ncbi:MAG: hypothetical protein HC924_04695 [Synechococcaceae cyanobacterium SM2_3_2]|nr:hypothetical protein [Synechococcaceae cyanobacterium SM2_3_2]
MEAQLLNIIEYLALGELESRIGVDYPHQQIFYQPEDRQAILQNVLNRMPPVYMWISPQDCPNLSQLPPAERSHLQSVVEQELQRRLCESGEAPCLLPGLMTDIFY